MELWWGIVVQDGRAVSTCPTSSIAQNQSFAYVSFLYPPTLNKHCAVLMILLGAAFLQCTQGGHPHRNGPFIVAGTRSQCQQGSPMFPSSGTCHTICSLQGRRARRLPRGTLRPYHRPPPGLPKPLGVLLCREALHRVADARRGGRCLACSVGASHRCPGHR